MNYMMSDWLSHMGYKEITLKATMTPKLFLHYRLYVSEIWVCTYTYIAPN